jgi:hypothetical protein
VALLGLRRVGISSEDEAALGGRLLTSPLLQDALTVHQRPERRQNFRAFLVHQVSDWGSGTAAKFGWMREAKRENNAVVLTDERVAPHL